MAEGRTPLPTDANAGDEGSNTSITSVNQPSVTSPAADTRSPRTPPQESSCLRQLRESHARMGIANRIALYGLLFAALAYVTPVGQDLYHKVFPDRALALLADQMDDRCLADWITVPGNEHLADAAWYSDERQVSRWEMEGRIIHANTLQANVSVRGNADKAVVIRDISISVLSRGDPARGTYLEGGGCGGGDGEEPEFLVVDLDTLPLRQGVPVSYLQNSESQKDARKAGATMGKRIALPRQVTTDGSYSFFLTGRTLRYDCTWIATVTWWDGEQEHTDRIDNDGRPFRVSAVTH